MLAINRTRRSKGGPNAALSSQVHISVVIKHYQGQRRIVNNINRDTGESLTTTGLSANALWMHPEAEMLAGAQG
jgi:hypothetical protein